MSADITPTTHVSMTLVRWLGALVAIAAAVWTVGTGYSDIKWTLRGLSERLSTIDARVQSFSPSTVRDEARRVCREVTSKQTLGCSCVRAQGNRLTCQCRAREEKDDE